MNAGEKLDAFLCGGKWSGPGVCSGDILCKLVLGLHITNFAGLMHS